MLKAPAAELPGHSQWTWASAGTDSAVNLWLASPPSNAELTIRSLSKTASKWTESLLHSYSDYEDSVYGGCGINKASSPEKICWGSLGWLEFDSMDQWDSVQDFKGIKEIFLEFKDVSHDFIPDERCVWIDLVGLPLASWAQRVYRSWVDGVGPLEAACLGYEGPSLDESLENEELGMSIVGDSDS
ncbi:hypothetical protein Tco_1195608 [Tanacetum coccineum]